MNKTTIEAYLKEHGELTYRNVGVSMLPMLKQGRDLFTLRKKTGERCKKYDVVLYRRPSGDYVLHRVIAVRPQDYVIRGDNCTGREYGITDEDVLGVMTGFVHRGKTYTVDDPRYRAYAHFRCRYNAVRAAVRRGLSRLRRLAGKRH